jgi:hypothetical protein
MSDTDDLGDFFAEINQIEEAAPEITQNVTEQVIVKAAETIVTRAAPVLHVSQSHAVYTYDFGDNYVADQEEASTADIVSKDNNQNISDLSHYTTIKPSSSSSSSSSSYSSSSSSATFHQPPNVSHVAVPPPVTQQNKKFVRTGAGEVWIDDTLKEWPEGDFRIFVGDLAKEVTTDHLTKHFQQYKSFAKAKVSLFVSFII